jgi:hypothetical protein
MQDGDSELSTYVPDPHFSDSIRVRPPRPTSTTMATTLFNFTLGGDPLSLDRIRGILTRLEDTIIFALIERAQFAHNPKAYQKGALPELKATGFEGSWLDWFLKETESFQGP